MGLQSPPILDNLTHLYFHVVLVLPLLFRSSNAGAPDLMNTTYERTKPMQLALALISAAPSCSCPIASNCVRLQIFFMAKPRLTAPESSTRYQHTEALVADIHVCITSLTDYCKQRNAKKKPPPQQATGLQTSYQNKPSGEPDNSYQTMVCTSNKWCKTKAAAGTDSLPGTRYKIAGHVTM